MGEAAFLPQQCCDQCLHTLCDYFTVNSRAFVMGVRAYVRRICYSFTRFASLIAGYLIQPRRRWGSLLLAVCHSPVTKIITRVVIANCQLTGLTREK